MRVACVYTRIGAARCAAYAVLRFCVGSLDRKCLTRMYCLTRVFEKSHALALHRQCLTRVMQSAMRSQMHCKARSAHVYCVASHLHYAKREALSNALQSAKRLRILRCLSSVFCEARVARICIASLFTYHAKREALVRALQF